MSLVEYEVVRLAIQRGDVDTVQQIILDPSGRSIVWSHYLPCIKCIEMAELLMPLLPVQYRRRLLYMISLWKGKDAYSFTELVDLDRVHTLPMSTDHEYIASSQKHLYNLPIEAIKWLYQGNYLKPKYMAIYEDSPKGIRTGCLSKVATLFLYRMDAIHIYQSRRVGTYPCSKDDDDRFYTYLYLHGKILFMMIREGYLPDIIKGMYASLGTYEYRCFKLAEHLLAMNIPRKDRDMILKIAHLARWVDILDKYK